MLRRRFGIALAFVAWLAAGAASHAGEPSASPKSVTVTDVDRSTWSRLQSWTSLQSWSRVVAPVLGQRTGAPVIPWRETWGGAEVSASAWSIYTGTTLALWSAPSEDGFRIRTSAGTGAYRYAGPGGVQIGGRTAFTDMLLGYQMRLGPATLKAFGGVGIIGHTLDAPDPGNTVTGLEYGIKGAMDLWFDLGAGTFLAADLGWGRAHGAYAGRVRWGLATVEALPGLSLGPELGAAGNLTYDGGRAGGFARYAWPTGEASVSAGMVGTLDRPDAPYGAVNVLLRY